MTAPHDDPSGPAPRRAGGATATEEQLVERLRALSTEFAVDPDPAYRAAARTRLVAMAAVRTPEQAGSGRRAPASGAATRLRAATGGRWRARVTAGLAGAALTVTALGGLLAAAQGAGPGDLLYDVKRGGEQTELALAGDSERGLTLLDFASTRLDEVRELVGVSPSAAAVVPPAPSGGEAGLAAGPDVDLVLDTLQTMDRQTSEGTAELTTRAVQRTDAPALDLLAGWTADQRTGLDELTAAVPAGAEGAVGASLGLVDAVAGRVLGLQEALACPGGPATAGADELGPVPAPCPAPEAPAGGAPAPGSTAPAPAPTAVDPAPATPEAPGAPAATPTAPAGPTGSSPAGGPAGGGVGGGAGGGVGGAAPTGAAPQTRTPRPGLPLPSLPLPGGSSSTTFAPPASPTTQPPVIDLPLPVCIDLLGRRIVC